MLGSRSDGYRCVDHAGGGLRGSRVSGCKGAAVRLDGRGAPPVLARNAFAGNGVDGVRLVGEGGSDDEDEDGPACLEGVGDAG